MNIFARGCLHITAFAILDDLFLKRLLNSGIVW